MVHGNTPLYLDIYQKLLSNIKEGLYKNGAKLPSEKEIAEQYDVSRITSKKAFEMLVDQGYIKRIPGKGSFVNDLKTESFTEQELSPVLVKRESKLIGLIIEEIGESFGTYTVAGVEQACAEHGYHVLLSCTYGDQKKEEKAIFELLQAGVAGFIIMPVHGDNFNPAILRLVIEDVPVVLIDRELKGVPASFVGTDNYDASYEITEYLFQSGHEKICIVSPMVNGTSTILERKKGFLECNMKHGSLPDEQYSINGVRSTFPFSNRQETISEDIELVMDFIKNNKEVTAFFGVEYNIALIIYRAIRNLGYRVPEDYFIVCFDSPVNFIDDYRFTFVRQNELQVAKESVRVLVDRIGGNKEIKRIYINSEIVEGRSTGKA